MNELEKYAPYEDAADIEELAPQDEGFWKSSFRIFKKNKIGMFAAVVLLMTVSYTHLTLPTTCQV